MHDTIFWRLVWKEYRTQRAFWLGVLVLALVLQVLSLYGCLAVSGTGTVGRSAEYCLGIAMLLPVFYALGCGAVSFASEREDGTDEMLRHLGTPPGRLFVSKIGLGMLGSLLMSGLLLAVVWVTFGGYLSSVLQSVHVHHSPFLCQYASSLLFSSAFLLWAVFFSLVTGHVLASAFLAAVATVVSVFTIVNAPWAPVLEGAIWDTWSNVLQIAWQIMLLMGVLGTADLWLARRWSLSRRVLPWIEAEKLGCERGARSVELSEASLAVADTLPWHRQFKRLLWLEWQRAPWPALYVLAGCLLLLHCFAETYDVTNPMNHNLSATFFILLAPVLMGVLAFHGEQRERGYRFLGARAVSPLAVWLSKHVIWLSFALVGAVVLLLLSPPPVRWLIEQHLGQTPQTVGFGDALMVSVNFLAFGREPLALSGPGAHFLLNDVWEVFCVVGLLVPFLYAAGQLASLFVPRVVMAVVTGAILGAFSFAWFWWVMLFRLPVSLFVVPLPILFLAVTLLHSRDWMEERHTRRAWVRVIALGVAPVALIVAGGIAYLVFRIPSVDLDFLDGDIPRAATSDELKTASKLQNSLTTMTRISSDEVDSMNLHRHSDAWAPPVGAEKKWVEENQDVIQQIVTVAGQEDCALLDPATTSLDRKEFVARSMVGYLRLARLLVTSAHLMESQDQLDQALDRYLVALRVGRQIADKGAVAQFVAGRVMNEYVYYWMAGWSAHAKQTPKLLSHAIDELEEHAQVLRRPSEALNVEFAVERHDERGAGQSYPSRGYVWWFWWLQPWERVARKRGDDFTNWCEYWRLKGFERAIQRRGFSSTLWFPQSRERYRRVCCVASGTSARLSWMPRRVLFSDTPSNEGTSLLLPCDFDLLVSSVVSHEARRRAFLITLALRAHHLEHGNLPVSLSELSPTYLADVPLDPWIGREFGYRPQGVSAPIFLEGSRKALASNVPFLFSAGPYNARPTIVKRAENSNARITFISGDDRPVATHLSEQPSIGTLEVKVVWPPSTFWRSMSDIGPDFYAGLVFPIPGITKGGRLDRAKQVAPGSRSKASR